MGRTTRCGDMAIWNFSKMDLFELEIAPFDPPSQKPTEPNMKYTVSQKKHVTTFSTITLTVSVQFQ